MTAATLPFLPPKFYFVKRLVWTLLILFAAAASAGVFLFARCKSQPFDSDGLVAPEICFGSQCYKVDVARTQVEQERGLMYRTWLAPGAGMLFIFDKDGDYPFWMKNTLIPLDIVWIGGDRKAAYIKRGAQPCARDVCPSIDPQVAARWVLEVNAGQMDGIGAKIGDFVTIKNVR